jgi:ATP-dependent RNA helicase RhlE
MLDMGFIHDIRKVLALLPENKHRQNLLFSATFSDEIKQLADRLLNKPVLLEVARRNETADRINQVIHPVDKSRKREMLSHLIGSNNWKQVLVFTRTKHGANRLAQQLEQDGLTAAAIHGNKSQGARTRALAGFKKGDVRVLVATDIAARGLDIDQLPHVVNYELPNVPEDYVHRIGRTGRAGNEGEAMSLVCVDELKLLKDIERLLKREIPKVTLEGYEPDLSIKPEPIQNGRNSGGRSRSGQQANGRGRSAPKKPANSRRPSNKGQSEQKRAQSKPAQEQSGNRANAKPAQEQSGNSAKAKPAQSQQKRSRSGPGRERPALLGGGFRN